jgi:hypothetical protein
MGEDLGSLLARQVRYSCASWANCSLLRAAILE